ncbi:MAG: hypothetical protein AAF902_11175 [Chloroflexota bacterium]
MLKDLFKRYSLLLVAADFDSDLAELLSPPDELDPESLDLLSPEEPLSDFEAPLGAAGLLLLLSLT